MEEREVLEKGLSFIPTPGKLDRDEIRRDLFTYHRRLKLLDYFQYEKDFPHIPFTKASTWVPAMETISPSIQNLIRKDVRALAGFRPKPSNQTNLTKEQLRALKDLKNNDSIVIKPADKGSQVVILDRVQYILEAEKQLSNTMHYVPLTHSIQGETQVLLREILRDLYQGKYITKKQLDYLSGPDTPRPRQFYLLPKIHKPPEKWSIPFQVPSGRPIVSDCSSESYGIAEYIDFYINPLSQRHSSYVRDTYDFVSKLKTIQAPKDAFLFSVDINSLYTNIDTQLGLQAVRETFEMYPNSARPDAAILQLLELSLLRNDFEFNDKFYLQIHGTAMGKKFAPAFANLYMRMWEETALAKSETTPLLYLRYLDDIFGIWSGSQLEFQAFLDLLNTHHPAITITHNIQCERLEFLDTQVFFIGGEGETKKLGTRVFFKDTDRHALLHKASFHPKHTYGGLIKSQLIRFHRICTFAEDVEVATRVLFQALGPRGYSKRFLREIKTEVKNRFLMGDKWVKATDNRHAIPFVSTYSRTLLSLNSKLRSNFVVAQAGNPELGDFRVISAFRRNKNLKDILVHSNSSKKNKQSVSPNNQHFSYLKHISNTSSGLGAPIWQRVGPESINVVYAIRCTVCQRIYVGETKNSLGARLKQHLYHIGRGSRTTLLYIHFQTHSTDSLQIIGLETNNQWTRPQRMRIEKKWIQTLNSMTPLGLNER